MSAPIYAKTVDANFHKLRALVARKPMTSEELASAMGLSVDVVRLLIHCSGEYRKVRLGTTESSDKWVWKGSAKK